MPQKLNDDLEVLLKKWEEAYKKGLLSFWLLLLLYDKPAYAYDLGATVSEVSQQTVTADEKSIYRALNRFQSLGLVQSDLQASKIGPQRRYYRLTEKGTTLLSEFIRRNILVFEMPSVTERVSAVMKHKPVFMFAEV